MLLIYDQYLRNYEEIRKTPQWRELFWERTNNNNLRRLEWKWLFSYSPSLSENRRINRSSAHSRNRFGVVHQRRWHPLFGAENKRLLWVWFSLSHRQQSATATTTTATSAAATTTATAAKSDSGEEKWGDLRLGHFTRERHRWRRKADFGAGEIN